MTDTRTNGDAADTIETEGAGYAVMNYCDGSCFDDPITRHLWDAAGNALEGLVEYLERQTGRDLK